MPSLLFWPVAVVALIIIFSALISAYYYNKLVRLRNNMGVCWATIDVQLQRRAYLMPSLAAIVLAVAEQEKGLFIGAAKARATFLSGTAEGVRRNEAAADELDRVQARLFAVSESYPQMRSDRNFLSLQKQLAQTEKNLAFARMFYNDNVTAYNLLVQTIPSNIVAALFGFRMREYFQTDADSPIVSKKDSGFERTRKG